MTSLICRYCFEEYACLLTICHNVGWKQHTQVLTAPPPFFSFSWLVGIRLVHIRSDDYSMCHIKVDDVPSPACVCLILICGPMVSTTRMAYIIRIRRISYYSFTLSRCTCYCFNIIKNIYITISFHFLNLISSPSHGTRCSALVQ